MPCHLSRTGPAACQRLTSTGRYTTHPEGTETGVLPARPPTGQAVPADTSMQMASSVGNAGFPDFLIAVVIAAGLAMLIFRHADKHGNRHATAWGLFTFLAALIAIPL